MMHFWSKFGKPHFIWFWLIARTNSQAQNGVNLDFQAQFDLEDHCQSPHKTIGISIKVFYISDPNLVILAWTVDELSHGQAHDWRTHRHTHIHTHTQATTIPEGQNWPRVKMTGFCLHGITMLQSADPPQITTVKWRISRGGGLLSQFSLFHCFPSFSDLSKDWFPIKYVHIWQMLLQLSCGDTCQIWMRLKKCSRYFCELKNFPYRKNNEWSFSTPPPQPTHPHSLFECFKLNKSL